MASNGNLPLSSLIKVDGWAYLAPATAAAWNGFASEMERLGFARPSITAPDGAYRNLAGQVYWKKYWTDRGLPGNAATPGYSNHGWGTAVDIFNVYQYPRATIRAVAAKYGFTFNVPTEQWHMQHNGTWPASNDITPIEEEDMTPEQDALLKRIATSNRPIRELIIGPDGTVWYCFERILRYAIPAPRNLTTYQAHLKALGYSDSITPKTATDLAAYGTPVFDFGNVNYGARGSQITAVLNEIAKIAAGGVDMDALADAIVAKLPASVSAPTAAEIAKAVNEDAANRLRD